MSFEQYGYVPLDSNKNSLSKENSSYEEPPPPYDVHDTDKEVGYKKYWYRWYIIAILAVLGLTQGAAWNTWSPIDESAAAVYGFTPSKSIISLIRYLHRL